MKSVSWADMFNKQLAIYKVIPNIIPKKPPGKPPKLTRPNIIYNNIRKKNKNPIKYNEKLNKINLNKPNPPNDIPIMNPRQKLEFKRRNYILY